MIGKLVMNKILTVLDVVAGVIAIIFVPITVGAILWGGLHAFLLEVTRYFSNWPDAIEPIIACWSILWVLLRWGAIFRPNPSPGPEGPSSPKGEG